MECYSKRSIKIRSERLSRPVPVIPPGEEVGPAPIPPGANVDELGSMKIVPRPTSMTSFRLRTISIGFVPCKPLFLPRSLRATGMSGEHYLKESLIIGLAPRSP